MPCPATIDIAVPNVASLSVKLIHVDAALLARSEKWVVRG
jgi:hypothetical protein